MTDEQRLVADVRGLLARAKRDGSPVVRVSVRQLEQLLEKATRVHD